MEFNPINGAGAALVALMLVPNIVYAVKFPGGENRCTNRVMNLLEQIGRYASMALMILPLGVWEFGFASVAEMLVYLLGNAALLAGYWGTWLLYFRKGTAKRALTLAVLPTCIFLLSGLMLRHWLLVAAGAVFGVAHIYVTRENQGA